ncbi:signal peptidase I [Ruminococcus sp.]|uniref:signal peptidase I n=1 Tax=Ruminococcus sp. TaxID=41978 RepID=UPI002BD12C2D|nr:signal peptidase I [Ruminococcus sp.]HNZ99295.1 signal peptidase I [Ruminococcus sp.]HOH87906.1 signal peptidase I [Ruminococcus sp.]
MADEVKKTTENTETETVAEAVEDIEEAAEDLAEAVEDEEDIEEDDDDAEEDEAEEQAKKKEGKFVDDIIEVIESTLLTVFVIVMIFTYLLHPVNVVGKSMNNTLMDGNRIFMTTVYTGPHYGDIIVINNDMAYFFDQAGKVYEKDITGSGLKECIIKRVIAEPGQTIDFDVEKEQVIVDGKVLDEPYIKQTVNGDGGMYDFPITVPEGYYFVMGDNRRESADSRNPDVGLIKKEQIYGKAVLRYSPIKEFKFLFFNNK